METHYVIKITMKSPKEVRVKANTLNEAYHKAWEKFDRELSPSNFKIG